jgi:transposase
MARRHEISDDKWTRIKDLLPPENTKKGRPSGSNRNYLNAMLWIAKTGSPWRDLPERFGSWKTVYWKFSIWSKNDVFQKIFDSLISDADMQDISIDSTSCKAHQHSAGAQKKAKTATQIKTLDSHVGDETPKSTQ